MDPQKPSNLFVYITLFVVLFGLYLAVLFSIPGLASGDDPYRHIATAHLLRTEGWKVVASYPWLPLSFPDNSFTDLWLLFHMLLVPFTYVPLLIGAKIATALFATLALVGFVYTLKKLEVKWPIFWLIVLLVSSSDFVYRTLLTRALLLNILFLLLTIAFTAKRRYYLLATTACLFMLNNVAAGIVLVITTSFVFFETLETKKVDWKLLLSPVAGLALGILIHPHPVAFIHLIIEQIAGTLFLAKTSGVSVGSEVYPYAYAEFFRINGLAIFIWVLGLVLARDVYKKNRDQKSSQRVLYWLGSLSLFFLVTTLHSKRFIEYWVPSALLFTSYVISQLFKNAALPYGKALLRTIAHQAQYALATCACIVVLSYSAYYSFHNVQNGLKSSANPYQFQGATEWLAANTPPGELVANMQWDEFPQLLYWGSRQRYVIGIDPIFLYLRNPLTYKVWLQVSDESGSWDPEQVQHNALGILKTRYIFLEQNRNWRLAQFLAAHPGFFEKRYEDEFTQIYEVKS